MKNFFNHFIRNNGIWVGGAVLLSKICTFLTMLVTVWFLSKDNLGQISSALNFLAFFTILAGAGSYQGVLRFGSIAEGEEKERLKRYSFTYGLLAQLIISFIFLAVAAVFYFEEYTILSLIAFLTIRFFGLFLLEHGKAEARADFNNKKFALLDIITSIALLALSIIGLYFYGLSGYVVALCVAPFTAIFFHKWSFSLNRAFFNTLSEKKFWKFSVTSAMATQIGEWIFLLDVFFITMFLGNASVAEFRVSNTIPMNLVFISYIILQTGYPELCKNYRDKTYQRIYLRNYFKTLIPIALIILMVSYFFPRQIMSIFGSQYVDTSLFTILILVCLSVMLLRAPFSYVLAALGKPHWTLWVSVFMMAVLSASYFLFTQKIGLIGVAWINVAGVTLSGLLYASAYLYESRRTF